MMMVVMMTSEIRSILMVASIIWSRMMMSGIVWGGMMVTRKIRGMRMATEVSTAAAEVSATAVSVGHVPIEMLSSTVPFDRG